MSKKILIGGLVAMLAVSALSAKTGDKLSTDKLMELKRSSKLLQNPTITIKKGMDKDSVYFLQLEAQGPRGLRPLTAFLDKKTGAVYFGGGFDKSGEQMIFPANADVVKAGIAFSVGTGKKELYVVTDPECPYCKKFEIAAKGKLDDYTVHYLFMPLSFHKEAPGMVQWILSGKTDAEKKERMEKSMALNDMSYKEDPSYLEFKKSSEKADILLSELRTAQKAKDNAKVSELQIKLRAMKTGGYPYSPEVKTMIENANKAAQELGARGTPAVFDGDFKSVAWPSLVKGTPTIAKVKKVTKPLSKPVEAKKVEAKKVEAKKVEESSKK